VLTVEVYPKQSPEIECYSTVRLSTIDNWLPVRHTGRCLLNSLASANQPILIMHPKFRFDSFRRLLFSICFVMMALGVTAAGDAGLKLTYAQPAGKWTEALPIGNGRMGAMVFGAVSNERIQFNEDTLWKGKPHDYVRQGAGEQLPEIRRLLAEGKTADASKLAKEKFLSDPVRQKAYQPFGDLRFHFLGQENPQDYRRELDLNSGIAVITYRVDEVGYRREVFASYPGQAIVIRLTADHRNRLSFTLDLDSPHTNAQTRALGVDTLSSTGQVEADGLRFESRVRVSAVGGQVTTNGSTLSIQNADSVTVLLVAATSFKNFQDISADPAERCARLLTALNTRSFEKIRADHVADHQKLFGTVTLSLGLTNRSELPTDERLLKVKASGIESDPGLAALYFQYGRYLLVASSRPGSQPANLQGVWNEELNPPWESKWTLNINCEMNYWLAESCNLSPCHEPLFDLINDLAISGARTAKKQYGARGWVAHHNTDLWRGSAPINNIDGVWPTGGAWLCQHLWEHYQFTGDKQFLTRAYPALKSASEFFLDFLIKDPKTGWLVSGPSYSPEQGSLCIGPTMDHQIIRALMTYTIQAAEILGKDQAFATELTKTRRQIAPNQIGRHGQLQEWLEDVDKPNNNHRHMSPLFALYPGEEITPANTNLFEAAKLLLKWRGEGSTGWSYAWRIPLWARVGDGDFALRQLNGLLQKRTLPNLFDLCGPFQIDGNFGATAGIAEMLLQSHRTEPGEKKSEVRLIELLPALPKAWSNGLIKGLCARDGFEVDITWEQGTLKQATLRSKLGRPCRIHFGGRTVELLTESGKEYKFDSQLKALAGK
jgi:alpha-L-fucosidase 2